MYSITQEQISYNRCYMSLRLHPKVKLILSQSLASGEILRLTDEMNKKAEMMLEIGKY